MPVKFNQFAKGAEDDAGIGAGWPAAGAREMVHANLGNGISAAGRAGENLGIDQRAGAPQFHIVKYLALEKLESAVDVFDPHAEKEADQVGPASGVELPIQAFPAVEAEAADDVILLHQRQKRRKLAQIELAVAVGVEDQCPGRGTKAGLQG